MKLSDWSKKQGISYLTAYRWFREGKLPDNCSAYQSDSGTIIIQDKEEAPTEASDQKALSLFLKKTIEFSKNNFTVEDFAAYIISNFYLTLK